MKVCVPRFPGRDLGLFRLGNAGLGNLLTIWGRAEVYGALHGHPVAWPCWQQMHVGAWLRNEPDKRSYAGIFRKPPGAVAARSALGLRRFAESEAAAFEAHGGPAALCFSQVDGNFGGLIGHHDILWRRLREEAIADLDAIRATSAGRIAVCVRLGDFKSLGWASPVDWFRQRLIQLRAFLPESPVWIFSDGTDEELAPLTRLPNVERAPAAPNALCKIAAISGSRALIATGGSTFYRWAAFLGSVPAIVHASDRWQTSFWVSLGTPVLTYYEDVEPSEESWIDFVSASPSDPPRRSS